MAYLSNAYSGITCNIDGVKTMSLMTHMRRTDVETTLGFDRAVASMNANESEDPIT